MESRAMHHRTLWVIAALSVVALFSIAAFGCSGSAAVENVDAAGARDAIAADAIALDIRTEGEYQAGHIPGAVFVPDSDYSNIIAQMDKTKTYVVYCATGSRSSGAVEFMRAEGFTSVKHMNRGLAHWYESGGPLATGAEPGDPAEAASWGGGTTGGPSAAVLQNPLIAPSGLPVVVEFKTDT